MNEVGFDNLIGWSLARIKEKPRTADQGEIIDMVKAPDGVHRPDYSQQELKKELYEKNKRIAVIYGFLSEIETKIFT